MVFRILEESILYPDGNVPEFKFLGEREKMSLFENRDELRFENIRDFKWCMKCGGEVDMEWNGIRYGIIRYGTGHKITIYVWNQPETERCFDSADDALEYMVGPDRLRDVITQVTVRDRTI